jgi:hypothetical protein
MQNNRPYNEIFMAFKYAIAVLLVFCLQNVCSSQQVQFPSTTTTTPWNPAPATGTLFPSAPPSSTGWGSVGGLQPNYQTAPGLPVTTPGSPNLSYGPATITPLGPPQPSLGGTYPGNYGNPAIYPNSTPPALFPSNSGVANPYSFNSGAGANSSLFSNSWLNGNNWRMGNGWFNNGTAPIWTTNAPEPIRFFQALRFRHTWLAGGDEPNHLQINDTDVSLAFAFPRFLGSTESLYVVPSFSSHLWDGPSNGIADLPGSAYSAFLDAGWQTDPMRTFGLETGIRLGVFTDYNTFTSESFRIMGKLIGRVRITPTAVGRVGAYWLDRNRIKLLPAVGITWTPNPDTRFDLFFPEPKLAHYLATFGRTDMWWYGTGYLGGGAWTITRADGSEDSIDINDIRIMLGLEFGRNEQLRAGQRVGFIEAGYAFNRELIYRIRPQDNLDPSDAFVLRAGFGY